MKQSSAERRGNGEAIGSNKMYFIIFSYSFDSKPMLNVHKFKNKNTVCELERWLGA